MEFEAFVGSERYVFSSINKSSYLVSGRGVEYILYRRSAWLCADEIDIRLLQALGTAIDRHEASSRK
jgi:hypothetical protein